MIEITHENGELEDAPKDDEISKKIKDVKNEKGIKIKLEVS